MKKIAYLGVALMLGAGAAFVAKPAQAAYSDCPSPRFCLWEHSDYNSPMYQYSPTVGTCYNLGAAINNRATSVYNRTGSRVRLFDGTGCTGSSVYIDNGYRTWNLSLVGSFNDKASSFRRE